VQCQWKNEILNFFYPVHAMQGWADVLVGQNEEEVGIGRIELTEIMIFTLVFD
jgi:hypothetical protein